MSNTENTRNYPRKHTQTQVLEKLLTKKCQDPKVLKCICCGKYDEDVELFRTAVKVVKNNKECKEAMLILALQFAWKKEDVRYVQVYVEEVSEEIAIDLKTLEEGRDSNVFWKVMTILKIRDDNLIEMWLEDVTKSVEYLKTLDVTVLREHWMKHVGQSCVEILMTSKNEEEKMNALIVLNRSIEDEKELMKVLIKLILREKDKSVKLKGVNILIDMAKNTKQRDAFKKCVMELDSKDRKDVGMLMKKTMSEKKKGGGGKKRRKKRVLKLKGF